MLAFSVQDISRILRPLAQASIRLSDHQSCQVGPLQELCERQLLQNSQPRLKEKSVQWTKQYALSKELASFGEKTGTLHNGMDEKLYWNRASIHTTDWCLLKNMELVHLLEHGC